MFSSPPLLILLRSDSPMRPCLHRLAGTVGMIYALVPTSLESQKGPKALETQIETVLKRSRRAPIVERTIAAHMLREEDPQTYRTIWCQQLSAAGLAALQTCILDTSAVRATLIQLDSAQAAMRPDRAMVLLLAALTSVGSI